MEKKELELYIHIPFCVKKCDYCDFLSFPADSRTQRRYVDALQKEITCYGALYPDRKITTIFIGGGTPSWLDEEEIVRILQTAEAFAVERDAEITIECNPGLPRRTNLSATGRQASTASVSGCSPHTMRSLHS